MELKIIPFTGVGPIRFGMSRSEVRQNLGGRFEEFKKALDKIEVSDSFLYLHLHVHYDAENRCEAVEMLRGSEPELNGQKFIGVPLVTVADVLRASEPNLEMNDSGFISRIFGIAPYAPDIDEDPYALIEAVYAFQKGIFGT